MMRMHTLLDKYKAQQAQNQLLTLNTYAPTVKITSINGILSLIIIGSRKHERYFNSIISNHCTQF